MTREWVVKLYIQQRLTSPSKKGRRHTFLSLTSIVRCSQVVTSTTTPCMAKLSPIVVGEVSRMALMGMYLITCSHAVSSTHITRIRIFLDATAKKQISKTSAFPWPRNCSKLLESTEINLFSNASCNRAVLLPYREDIWVFVRWGARGGVLCLLDCKLLLSEK